MVASSSIVQFLEGWRGAGVGEGDGSTFEGKGPLLCAAPRATRRGHAADPCLGGPKLGRKMGAATWRASHSGRMRCSVLEYGVGGM